MQEFEQKILEQYDIEVNSTRKVRGAVLCDTNRGWFLLKEVSLTANRIPALCELYEYLRTEGYTHLDHIEMNREGGHITEMENGEKYILKHWCDGKECEIRRSEELSKDRRDQRSRKLSGKQGFCCRRARSAASNRSIALHSGEDRRLAEYIRIAVRLFRWLSGSAGRHHSFQLLVSSQSRIGIFRLCRRLVSADHHRVQRKQLAGADPGNNLFSGLSLRRDSGRAQSFGRSQQFFADRPDHFARRRSAPARSSASRSL